MPAPHRRSRLHAIVIGTGFGGLAAALRLRAKGYRVTVLEALDQPGGRARVFQHDGYTFDAGPTVITAPYLLEELFTLFGKHARDYYTLVTIDPLYRILFDDGRSFDYVADEAQLLAQIDAFDHRDVDGYRKLAAQARRIFETGYLELADRPFGNVATMLRVLPTMIRLRSDRSVYDTVARYIRNEQLRQVFSFEPLLVGGNPFRTTSIYLLIHWLERHWGIHYALGGTGAIIQALTQLLAETGVEIRYNCPVNELVIEHGKIAGVLCENTSRIDADLVVSNADPSFVYTHMIAPRYRAKNTDQRVQRIKQSMSLFVGYMGTRGTFPHLAHHTILLGPRYRELLEDIFERHALARDMSLYLHAPTRTDPSMAPLDCETMYVLAPVPNNRSGIVWAHEGARYFARVRDVLQQRLLPGLDRQMVTSQYLTPDDFEYTLRSADGAAFGPEPRLTQSAYFRYHNQSRDVPGLYFVGAGTHPGAGVPGVLCSAKVLDRLVPDCP